MNFLTSKTGYRLAYHFHEGDQSKPVVVFLGGFKSDMTGSKATFLDRWTQENNIGFIRFDYSGHGASEGDFEDGTIGGWTDDALSIIDIIGAERPLILVGSSMGGWIALLCALKRPSRIKALIGIAAAPDFTQEIASDFEAQGLTETLEKDGKVVIPSDYDEPYIFTKKLLEDGAQYCLLDKAIAITCPVRLLQGQQDSSVPWEKALRIADALESTHVTITLIKDGDHGLSRPKDLRLLRESIEKEIQA